jgi:hypothetical protein
MRKFVRLADKSRAVRSIDRFKENRIIHSDYRRQNRRDKTNMGGRVVRGRTHIAGLVLLSPPRPYGSSADASRLLRYALKCRVQCFKHREAKDRASC